LQAEEEVTTIEANDPMGLLGPKLVDHEVPTQKDIEAALLKKKKDDLLEKYGLLDT
jgi:pre-mRNA-splicing factor ISY1